MPMLGERALYLGIRVPRDIEPDEKGQVTRGTNGLSVTPDDPRGLPLFARPPELGGRGIDPVWELDLESLPEGLAFIDDEPTHGYIAPANGMSIDSYRALIRSTRPLWRRT